MSISIDKIAEELQKISTRIDYTDLHTSIDKTVALTKSGEMTKLGLKLGENLGGFEALTETAKTEAEKLLVLYEPVITLMSEFVPGLEKDIKKSLTSDNETAINSIISSSAVDIHAVVPSAEPVDIHATTVTSSMNHKVISDGSPIALKAGVGTATSINIMDKFEDMMKEVTEDDLKDAVTEAVEVLQSDELKTQLTNTFKDLDTKIIKATNGLNSGSLLKDVTENFSSTFGNILSNFIKLLISVSTIYILGIFWLGSLIGWDKPIISLGVTPILLAELFKIIILTLLAKNILRLRNLFR